LAFPGVFLGALQVRANTITNGMKIGAAFALADCVKKPTVDNILPTPLDREVAKLIAKRVAKVWREEQTHRLDGH
jgi:malate dehydrogenase (oxaloacetate-decarboxylating)